MKKLLFALAVLFTLAACAEKKPAIPLYGWEGIGKNPDLEEVRIMCDSVLSVLGVSI